MLVTTPCNEGRKGDMFWTKNTPYDGVVWEVAQSTPEANFAELPRHTGYFFGWGYTESSYELVSGCDDANAQTRLMCKKCKVAVVFT